MLRPVFRDVAIPHAAPAARTPGEFDLPINALWATDPRPDLTIECVRGGVWVTQAGDDRDVTLAPGETFTPAPVGRVVVQALVASRVRVRPS